MTSLTWSLITDDIMTLMTLYTWCRGGCWDPTELLSTCLPLSCLTPGPRSPGSHRCQVPALERKMGRERGCVMLYRDRNRLHREAGLWRCAHFEGFRARDEDMTALCKQYPKYLTPHRYLQKTNSVFITHRWARERTEQHRTRSQACYFEQHRHH